MMCPYGYWSLIKLLILLGLFSSCTNNERTIYHKAEQVDGLPGDKYIDTKYEYTDSTGKHLIIQNSLPKGGLKYTDLNGKDYVYAIFWTSITNEAASPLEVMINFPADSFELLSSVGNYFKIFFIRKQ